MTLTQKKIIADRWAKTPLCTNGTARANRRLHYQKTGPTRYFSSNAPALGSAKRFESTIDSK